jgi:hypothetical protein
MKRTKTSKPYWDMTTEELAEATKQFDREIDLSETRPLTKSERARWERAKRAPDRSIYLKAKPTRAVVVRIEPELLQRTDRYATAHGMSRDELIRRSLRGILAFAE